MIRKIILLFVISIMLFPPFANGAANRKPHLFRELIHLPTAGIFHLGESDFDMRIYSDSGIHLSAGLGLRNNTMIGFTLGGENIIGDGLPEWNPQIEFDIKYLAVGETRNIPAIAIGFDSQGYGTYHDNPVTRYRKDPNGAYVVDKENVRVDRYDYKSRGLYLVATKNYPLGIGFGRVGFHAGFNFSLETRDNDRDLNFFVGMDWNLKKLSPNTFFMFEYDAALNDNDFRYQVPGDERNFGAKESLGYLNLGIRWQVSEGFTVEGALTDLLESAGTYGREIRMTYTTDLLKLNKNNPSVGDEDKPKDDDNIWKVESYKNSEPERTNTNPYEEAENYWYHGSSPQSSNIKTTYIEPEKKTAPEVEIKPADDQKSKEKKPEPQAPTQIRDDEPIEVLPTNSK